MASILVGKVVGIVDKGVRVDVGGGRVGFVPNGQLCTRSSCGREHRVRVGHPIEVVMLRDDPLKGPLLSVTRTHAVANEARLTEHLTSGEPVEVRVVRKNNGGLVVDVLGAEGFIPASLVDRDRSVDMSSLVGRRLEARIIEWDADQGRLVLDRRALQIEQERAQQGEALSRLSIGSPVQARIDRRTAGGAVLDAAGASIFVPRSELCWPGETDESLRVGATVDVLIEAVDVERGSALGSIRKLRPEPWGAFVDDHDAGSLVRGTVRNVTHFGAFVGLAPAVDGLVHVSEYPPDLPLDEPPLVGEELWAQIVRVDRERRRIALTMRVRGARSLAEERRWRAAGISSTDIDQWDALGFSPEEAGRWSLLPPLQAAAWRDAGFSATSTAGWLRWCEHPAAARAWASTFDDPGEAELWAALFEPAEALRWLHSGLDPKGAAAWSVAGAPPETAAAWRDFGAPADEAVQWWRAGFSPEEAEPWVRSGLTPAQRDEWVESGVDPLEAGEWSRQGWAAGASAPWREAGFSASAATGWRRIGATVRTASAWRTSRFAPTSAKPWLTTGWDPSSASTWRRARWSPDEALEWRGAGWENAKLAAVWAEAGASPEVALLAHRAGLAPDVLASRALPAPPARPQRSGKRRTADPERLFGVPGPDTSARWAEGVKVISGGNAAAWPPPDERLHALLWKPPGRLTAADVVLLLDRLASNLGSRGWEGTARRVLAAAVPILAPPADAAVKMQGEAPPVELLPDLRLPYEAVAIVLGAAFEIPREHREELLPVFSTAPPSYQPWLAHLRSVGGAVRGVVLVAGPGGVDLSDSILWLTEIDGELIPVPGLRSRSVMDPLVGTLAAAVCWGGWSHALEKPPRVHRSQPRNSGGFVPDRALPRPRPPVHVVDVRPRRNEYTVSTGPGGSRAAHIRRGHWKRARIGPRDDWEYIWQWRDPTYVNGRPPEDTPTTVYRLPAWILPSGD